MKLSNAITLAKSMKRPIIYVNQSYILGTDLGFRTLSMIVLTDDHVDDLPRPIAVRITYMVLDEKKKTKFSMENPSYWFNYYEQITESIYIDRFNESVYMNKIMALYNRCMSFDRDSVSVINIPDMYIDDNFSSLISMKLGDGMKYNIIHTDDIVLYLSTFASLHPVTKSDKIGVECKLIDGRSFLAKFTILKKKTILTEYIRYRIM